VVALQKEGITILQDLKNMWSKKANICQHPQPNSICGENKLGWLSCIMGHRERLHLKVSNRESTFMGVEYPNLRQLTTAALPMGPSSHPYWEIVATGVCPNSLDVVMMFVTDDNGLDAIRLYPNLSEA
jgi:hypothetical protein